MTAATNELISPTLMQDYAADMRVFPPVRLVRNTYARPVGTESKTSEPTVVDEGTGNSFVRSSGAKLPYLRDYVDVSLMILFAFGLTLGLYVGRCIETLLSDCRATGILNEKAINETELRGLVAEANRLMSSPYIILVIFVVSTVIVVGIWVTLATNGIYPSLGPAGDYVWQGDLYRGS